MDLNDLVDILNEHDDLCGEAQILLTEAMKDGAKKGHRRKWLEQSFDEHLEHAIIHLLKAKIGDEQERHLSHGLCRIAMASFLLNNYDGNERDSGDEGRTNVDGESEKGVSEGEQEEGTTSWYERLQDEFVPKLSPDAWIRRQS